MQSGLGVHRKISTSTDPGSRPLKFVLDPAHDPLARDAVLTYVTKLLASPRSEDWKDARRLLEWLDEAMDGPPDEPQDAPAEQRSTLPETSARRPQTAPTAKTVGTQAVWRYCRQRLGIWATKVEVAGGRLHDRGERMKIKTAALVLGATMRLTRLVVTDDVGQWWIKDRVDAAAEQWWGRHTSFTSTESVTLRGHSGQTVRNYEPPPQPWWWKYRSGLDCPYCVGFWIGAAVLATAPLIERSRLARYVAAALTLNYVAAHAGARLGDTAPEHDDE